jgi:glycosyltransferase involved in cell wall biosynthesis
MATRKVAYVTPLYFDEASCLGGGERYPLNLGRGVVAASRGAYEVDLISFGKGKQRTLPLGPGINLRVLERSHQPRQSLDVVSWDLSDALAGVDLVHFHQVYNRCFELGLLLAKYLGKPVCATDHGGESSRLVHDLNLLDLVDTVVAYSDFGAKRYRTRSPLVTIKGGVDANLFHPPEVRPKRVGVLYVGRLLPHKGIDRLIEVLPSDLPLTVCGRPYHDAYFERLKELSVGKRVQFVTDADDACIRRLYESSWVNVLPSVYEDCYGTIHAAPELMGFTLLEAMACGTPAICSRVAAMPEFVKHGVTGFVYDTPEELASQLRRLATDPALVERLGLAAREEVEREFALEVAGAKLVNLYEDLITRSKEQAA